MSNIQEG